MRWNGVELMHILPQDDITQMDIYVRIDTSKEKKQ